MSRRFKRCDANAAKDTNVELTQLSNAELADIFNQESPPPEWEPSSWKIHREHAYGTFWNRRLANGQPLSNAELEELLQHKEFDTALGALGDAARLDLLSPEQCESIQTLPVLDGLPKSDWLRSEVKLRTLARELESEAHEETRRDLLDQLLHQRRLWPIVQVIDQLAPPELEYCLQALDDKSVLTKQNRELARQAIRKALKDRQ